MRFNKCEVTALAGQPSHKFEKEGVLFVREKQDGFFKRSEISVERWCRLRGNLLFYFKSRDHFSDPAGVIVVEDCKVEVEDKTAESTFGIILTFRCGLQQQLASYTEYERDSWLAALRAASHNTLRSHLDNLKEKLRNKLKSNPALWSSLSSSFVMDDYKSSTTKETVIDPSEGPILEISLSCDNLLCDALGRAPSARVVVEVRNPPERIWKRIAQSEAAEKSSNPSFLRTIAFRASEGLSGNTEIRFTAFDYREKLTSTCTQLGRAQSSIEQLKTQGRCRLKLESPNPEGRTAGFVTVNAWTFENKVPGSTDSTPHHQPNVRNGIGLNDNENSSSQTNVTLNVNCHRRTQSLPPNTQHMAKCPNHLSLLMIAANPVCKTYGFHSGLAGDINVQELLAESKLAFTFPQQLLSLWICEEKELVHEIAGLGELRSPWHENQMTWLENHLHIINIYTQALENLDAKKVSGRNFRKSTQKSDKTFEFVPTNLHLQRIWVENESLRKSGTFDVMTHGAFTAMTQKSPGLIKMLKDLKAPQKDSSAWCTLSDNLQMAEDTLSAVRRVRREVVDSMRVLMKQGKERKADGMFALVEDMMRKTKCLCNLLDQTTVEEAFGFLEDNRIAQRPEKDEFSESVAEFMQRNKLKIDLPPFRLLPNNKFDLLQTPNTEFVSKELRTPEVDVYGTPETAADMAEFWRSYSAYTSGYQSVDCLSDIDEFEETFKYMSVMDKTRHYYTLCRAETPVDTPPLTPNLTPKRTSVAKEKEVKKNDFFDDDDEGFENDAVVSKAGENVVEADKVEKEDAMTETAAKIESDNKSVGKKEDEETNKVDQGLTSDCANGLHYRAGDEPEPIDLTHLNIEAAMMCLASKVRVLCGKANSPTLSSRTFRFRELDEKKCDIPKSASADSSFKIPDVPKPNHQEEEIADWAAELRPSMRKLRQGMDSLCKTSRLVCSVLRLQQRTLAVNLSHNIKYRRDVCFSQALTSLTSALMIKFWATEPDPCFLQLCVHLGPLACFESLLSMHGEDVTIFNDMLVAVEDLRQVEFTLILVDKKPTSKSKFKRRSGNGMPIMQYHSFPLPRVTGSRNNLKVLLPVPDYVYTMIPMEQIKALSFSVTPVLFNIGINEKATLAGRFGNNGPQEKNNVDNFKILAEYWRRFKKLGIQASVLGSTNQNNRSKRNSLFSNEPKVDDLLAILKNEVNNRKNKNVDILHLAADISRRVLGFRFTCCKSGKDRTGMAATLEQVQILSKEFDLAEHEYQKALDVMRSEGTRRDNVQKNINDNKYAFTTLQLTTFPYQYRAPVGSYGSSIT